MELRCPKCHTAFQVNESDYASILSQVKNAEFEAELNRRIQEIVAREEAEERSRKLETEKELQRLEAERNAREAQMTIEIERLKAIIENNEADKKAELAKASAENEARLMRQTLEDDRKFAETKRKLDIVIEGLKSEITLQEQKHHAAILTERQNHLEEKHNHEQQIAELNALIEAERTATESRLHEINEAHATMMRIKEDELRQVRDMRARLSTKMLGETLEQHCLFMFNRARSQGQYLSAYFEKDNDASGGSKGDFIFRDYYEGEEYISIMFEMKNEDDKTATKHRNEDFFSKLDKDRREKNCEYAVLVTMLEADSEFYNEGIVDVSYRYEKMFVVRPQFFMSIIALLSRATRQGAMALAKINHELQIARAQSVDVTNFEIKRDEIALKFRKYAEGYLKKQEEAMDTIDKAILAAEKQIENLRRIKRIFEQSGDKLVRANNVIQNDFTIKKLTHGNPTMRQKFNDARQSDQDNSATSDDIDI